MIFINIFLKVLELMVILLQYIVLIIIGFVSIFISVIQGLILEEQVIEFDGIISWFGYYHGKIGCLYLSLYFRLKYNKKMMFYKKQERIGEVLINNEKYTIPINPNDNKIKIDFFDKKIKLADITIINRILKIF